MYGTNFTVQVEVVGWITFREVALYLYFRGFNKSRLLQFCLRVGSPALVFLMVPFPGIGPYYTIESHLRRNLLKPLPIRQVMIRM